MAPEERSARYLAARLIARARKSGGAPATGGLGAVETAFHLVLAELSRWIGAGGCHALLTQALRKARADHPALAAIVSASDARLDRLTESVEAHGAKEIAAGLEAALVALIDLLGRLIGDDLSTKLVEMSMKNDVPDAAKPDAERAFQP
jgi:hypothetical protein